jgi:hypothetical protein
MEHMKTCHYWSEAKEGESIFLHFYSFQNLLITGETENQYF